jgi:L,D-peptidoglycan transpeptidase YkuD (ErfK/YbiS/YcfS/YnhG family)
VAGHRHFPCLLGKSGMRHAKREGDGASPVGAFRMVKVYWRADRLSRPATTLPMQLLKPDMGWCDAPGHRLYNRPVRLPFAASHEILARADNAYDVLVMLDYNLSPRLQQRGSAIFFHLISDRATHTEGCIAVTLATMHKLLPMLGAGTRMMVGPNRAPRK